MRVARWTDAGIEVAEVEPRPLREGWVRLRVAACGICGLSLVGVSDGDPHPGRAVTCEQTGQETDRPTAQDEDAASALGIAQADRADTDRGRLCDGGQANRNPGIDGVKGGPGDIHEITEAPRRLKPEQASIRTELPTSPEAVVTGSAPGPGLDGVEPVLQVRGSVHRNPDDLVAGHASGARWKLPTA